MGGQFPLKKAFGAFKNPLFFDGFRGANRPKIELSLLMPKKTTFYAFFPTKVSEETLTSDRLRCDSRCNRTAFPTAQRERAGVRENRSASFFNANEFGRADLPVGSPDMSYMCHSLKSVFLPVSFRSFSVRHSKFDVCND
jgi:hypothetical protein